MDEPARPEAEEAPILEPLLAIHSATTAPWLADAAATAAERGLGALYALLYLEAATGELEGVKPVSGARNRGLGKLRQEIGSDPCSLKFAPESFLAVSNAIREGHAVAVRELGHALPFEESPEQLRKVQETLGIGRVWLAPLSWDGQVYGVLVLLMPDEPPAQLAQAELLGKHVAVAARNMSERESGRRLGELDEVRWVYDQQRFEQQLGLEIHRARRHKRPLSIMLLRVDNFHDVRRRYGRFLAERLLRQVGSELEAPMRDTDFLGAFRDDGFAAILVEADAAAAELARQRLTRGLTNVQIPNAEIDSLVCQLSCATATTPDDGETAEELSAAAEARLDADLASLHEASA